MRGRSSLAFVAALVTLAAGCLPRVEWRDGGDAGPVNDIAADRVDVATTDSPDDVQSEVEELDAETLDAPSLDEGSDASACDGGPCAQTVTLLAPLSGSVTAGPPRLQFRTSAATADHADIMMCHDRGLTDCTMFTATTATRAPVGAGTWFWRARTNTAGDVGVTWSPTWEFVVSGSATTGETIASLPDVNGDGLGDAIVGSLTTSTIDVAYGGSALPSTSMGFAAMALADSGSHSWLAHCDVNGDGFVDLIVGAANGGGGAGAVFAVPGGMTGLRPAEMIAVRNSGSTGDKFGYSVSCAGDINHDGLGDIAVGAPQPGTGDGYVAIVRGPLTDVPVIIRAPMATAAGGFGASIAGNADINLDGEPDLVVGEPYYSANSGRAHVLLGGGGGFAVDMPRTFTLGGSNHFTGIPVAFVGDVDGDGRVDYAIASAPFTATSYVHVVLSGGSPIDLMGQAGFGSGLAGSDIDQDDDWDVIVGSPRESSPEGRLYRYLGPTLTAANPSPAVPPSGSGALGSCIGFAGDMNGDGTVEFLVGNPGGGSGAGSVVIYSEPGALGGTASGMVTPAGPRTNFGTAIAH